MPYEFVHCEQRKSCEILSNNLCHCNARTSYQLPCVALFFDQGARKCTYYMRNGTCRYGKKCCFNHPEQVLDVQHHTATGWDDTNLQSSPHSKKSRS